MIFSFLMGNVICLSIGYMYRWELLNKILMCKIKLQNLLHSNYKINSYTLYSKNNEEIEQQYSFEYLIKNWKNYKTTIHNNLNHIIIFYQIKSKKYCIIYTINDVLKNKPYNKLNNNNFTTMIISAIDSITNKDITQDVIQLMGPHKNFYKDLNLSIQPKYMNWNNIQLLDSNLQEYVIKRDEIFYIK